MVGLKNTAAPQKRAEAMPKPGSSTTQAGGKVSPQEQEQYDKVVSKGMELIYNQKVMPQLVQSIQGDGNPVEGLANVVSMVMLRLDDASAQAGEQMSPGVRAHAAKELLEQVAELAGPKGADVHEFSRQELEAAYQMASGLYDMARSGGAGSGAAPPVGQPPGQPQQGAMQQPPMPGPGGLSQAPMAAGGY